MSSLEPILGKLYYTIGLPRSGKSTYCDSWVDNGSLRVIVSSDDIRKSLHGQRYEPLAETMVFAIKHVMIRSLLSRGFDVIVDGTHSTKVSIQRLLEIDINAIYIWMGTSPEECWRRAIKSNQFDLFNTIERIHNNILKFQEIGLDTFIEGIKKEIAGRGLF